MIKDFFIKKENIFISVVAIISIFCVVLGFLFLFLRAGETDGPRIIPSNVYEIKWTDFSSKIIKNKIQYPEYMHVNEQREVDGVGVTFSEFKPTEFLTYFSNQNHVSIYPSGIDNHLFYAKTRESDYTSSTNQDFTRTEYLTVDNQVWAVMLVPKITPENWQSRGFIWIQTAIKSKEVLCMNELDKVFSDENCDPYAKESPVYTGDVTDKFIRFGYELVNKNTF